MEGAHEHIRKMEARRERPQTEPKPQPTASEVEQKLRRTIAQLRHKLRYIADSSKGTVFLKPGDRRKIRSALHPDPVLDPVGEAASGNSIPDHQRAI